MKSVFLLFVAIVTSYEVKATVLPCGPKQFVYWAETHYTCINRMPATRSDCIVCQTNLYNPQPIPTWLQTFPSALYQPQPLPWWATQGNFYYPNLHYPGAWNYPGMNSHFYPGQGEVFAAKPNVYIESIHKDKKFELKFPEEENNFLATTPYLEKNTWKGKIVSGDRFEVDDIFYDYLFYDIRLPKEKMQFEHGLCSTRDFAIQWMLKDLRAMNFSKIARQDFEEHWSVKVPNYPYYCIYPQYNKQLDEALPVTFVLEQSYFVRSLYVLVPFKEEPDADRPVAIPFPVKDPQVFRPSVLIKRENTFKEWGVAFMDENTL